MNILHELQLISRKVSIRFIIEIASIIKFFKSYSLLEEVKFHQYKAVLTQGVNKPYWNLCVDTVVPSARFENVHEQEFRKIYSLQNIYTVYKSAKSFYYSNWYDIWVNRGLQKGDEYLLWK